MLFVVHVVEPTALHSGGQVWTRQTTYIISRAYIAQGWEVHLRIK